MEGKLLGNRYELLEKIGGGGMAVVYKARCKLLNRYVAVKILRPEFTSDSEFINRFKVEAQAAASLSHPNIVPIYDVGNQDDLNYIVMEYINGKTLKEYIVENGSLPWKTAVNIAIQICSALEHAHKNHIVHRDIKPHNIIITKELIAKVTDFGIARAVSGSTLTVTGNTIGSVHYFSPEQARGAYTDEKSDLYSLGIVLYEMITGKVPFDGETPVTVALKHLEDEMTPPVKLVSSIPAGVNSIILKAAQKSQANRYQSACEMLDDLYSALKEPDGNFVKINNPNLDHQATQRITVPEEMREFNFRSNRENSFQGESEEMPAKKKKSDRVTVIAALATSFLIILLISGLAGYFVYSKLSNRMIEIDAPNVVGMNLDEARNMLGQSRISVEVTETRYDEKAPKDTILKQTPEAGIRVKTPGEIQVVVSSGQETATVPDLTGREYRDAQYELQKKGLVMKMTREYSSEIPQNYVIRQNPLPQTVTTENSEVEVFVSDGPEPVKISVPNLVGMTRDEAKRTISQNGLVLENILYAQDKAKAYDTVLKQSLEPGSEVENLSKVIITLNSYKKTDNNGDILRNLYINLTNKGERETFTVTVEVDGINGKKVAYQKQHTREDSEIVVPVSGKGTAIVRVYIDGQKDSEEVIDFGGEEQ